MGLPGRRSFSGDHLGHGESGQRHFNPAMEGTSHSLSNDFSLDVGAKSSSTHCRSKSSSTQAYKAVLAKITSDPEQLRLFAEKRGPVSQVSVGLWMSADENEKENINQHLFAEKPGAFS